MAIYRLKHSFSAGELSPLMKGRLDFARYKNGCSMMHNMICTTQGPTTRRSGFRFIYDLNSIGLNAADPRVRMVPFIFNEIQAYALIFYVHTDNDVRLVFGDKEGLLTYSDPPAELCPPTPVNTYLFDTAWAGDYDIDYVITADTDIKVIHTSAVGTDTTLVLATDYTVTIESEVPHTLTMISAPTADGEINIYIYNQGVAGEIVTLNLGPVVAADHDEGDAGWDIEHFDWAQSGDIISIAQEGQAPSEIRRHGPECWDWVIPTLVDQPADWSDTLGWPGKVTYHQQRIAFAATILKRQTVWMSKAGDFYDFGQNPTIIDSDAITFTLDSGTQNKIAWMISAKSLNVGTIGNEWTVTGSTRDALTPFNVLAQRQTNHGGEFNKALMVGITTLFVEKYGRVINEFVYDYTFDSYKTSDMSILSSHVTKDYSIVDWTYQQTPDSIIWSIRSDGALLGITYQRQHEVIGWHVHSTLGSFLAITSIPGDTREDEVWTIVKRVIGGSDKYYVEKKADQFKSDDAKQALFLDSYVYKEEATPFTVITGLDHAEGESVNILAGGAIHPDLVVSGGQVELNGSYEVAIAGFNFISEIRPLVPDVATADGTPHGRMQRVTDLEIDFYNTLGGWVGRRDSEDGDTEEELPFRVPSDPTGNPVPLFTGIYHMNFLEGFDREVEYFIRQKQPLPLTVRAITDSIEVRD